MDVTNEILEKIKCSQCRGYLSLGPVYIKQTGEAVCCRCKRPKDQLTRNKQYEALASLVKFPCKYQELGCKETIPFYEGQPPAHELGCDFKQYLCPVVESGRCDWLGRRCEILKHCQDKHKEKVLTNPCTLTHDITKFSLNTFLLKAFEFLFLLHTKVCLTSGKIYHSIRILGDPELATKFKYVLEIKKGDLTQSKPGRVAPEGCLAIQEDSSLATGINSLLEFLDGYDGTVFKIRVQALANVVKCAKDGRSGVLTGTVDKNAGSAFCVKCASTRRDCKYKSRGCKHNDINEKCEKHETYFCRYSKCPICNTDIYNYSSTSSGHYQNHHYNYCYVRNDLYYSITQSAGLICTASTKIGPILFFYKYNSSELTVDIFSELESEKLNKYDFTVKIYNSNFKIINAPYSLQSVFGKSDWELKLTNPDLPQYGNVLYLNFDIKEK